MKVPEFNIGVSYAVEHDKERNKVKCTLTADSDWPVFVTYGKNIRHKTYSPVRVFTCKPEQFDVMLHGTLLRAHKRLKQLRKTQTKIEALPTYTTNISTKWYLSGAHREGQHES